MPVVSRVGLGLGSQSSRPPPDWVLAGATFAIDFRRQRGWRRTIGGVGKSYDAATLGSIYSTVRDSTGPVFASSGLRQVAAINTPRLEHSLTGSPLGILLERAATNVGLHSRDLTISQQLTVSGGSGTFVTGETVTAAGGGSGTYVAANSSATLFAVRGGTGTFSGTLTGGTSGATRSISSSATVWAKTTMTAAQSQVGMDGVAGSATALTAAAGNATCLQAVTLASSQRSTTAYLWRLVGTGTIQMTTDGGSTWTTVAVTSTRTRFDIPAQTLANPSFGIRIVTSGDSVGVDLVQNEAGSSPTSAVATTTAAASRSEETVVSATTGWLSATAGTLVVRMNLPYLLASSARALCLDDGTNNNRIAVCAMRNSLFTAEVSTSGVEQAGIEMGATAVGRHGVVFAWSASSFAASLDAAAALTDTSGTVPTGLTQMEYGRIPTGGLLNGLLEAVQYLPRRAANDEVPGLLALVA